MPHQLCHSDSYSADLAFETLVLLLEKINIGLGLLIRLKIGACQLFPLFASGPGSTFTQNGAKGPVIYSCILCVQGLQPSIAPRA